jgi:hypothetical protein
MYLMVAIKGVSAVAGLAEFAASGAGRLFCHDRFPRLDPR